MTIIIELAPELRERLQTESAKRGQTVDAVVVDLLNKHLPMSKQASIQTLRQWAAEVANLSAEEYASNLAVLRAIDEVRLSDRKLFETVSSNPLQL